MATTTATTRRCRRDLPETPGRSVYGISRRSETSRTQKRVRPTDESGRASMSVVTIGAVAAPFDRDVEAGFGRIATLLDDARARGLDLVVLPEAAIGGYVADLHGVAEPPPALDPDGPEIRRLVDLAGDLVVCAGFCEDAGDVRYNAAVCVGGGDVLGRYRKVHQPLA